jgi:hypothetical protein
MKLFDIVGKFLLFLGNFLIKIHWKEKENGESFG